MRICSFNCLCIFNRSICHVFPLFFYDFAFSRIFFFGEKRFCFDFCFDQSVLTESLCLDLKTVKLANSERLTILVTLNWENKQKRTENMAKHLIQMILKLVIKNPSEAFDLYVTKVTLFILISFHSTSRSGYSTTVPYLLTH